MKLIILIGQRVRVGTNFIGSTLGNHPEVQSVPPNYTHGEFNLFRDRQIENTYQTVSKKSFGLKFNNEDEANFYRKYGELWLNFLVRKFNLNPDKSIFIKSPVIENYDLWLKTFPEAKFIFLTRDGRDNVVSSVKASNDRRNWHTFKIKAKKRINFHSGRSFLNHLKDWKKSAELFQTVPEAANIKKIRYDEMLNSFDAFSKIFTFLDINNSEKIIQECLDSPVVGSSFGVENEKVSKSNWSPVQDKSKFKFLNKWSKWGKFKKAVFKFYAGDNLIDLGFEKNKHW